LNDAERWDLKTRTLPTVPQCRQRDHRQ
jgi:hypothetical protein